VIENSLWRIIKRTRKRCAFYFQETEFLHKPRVEREQETCFVVLFFYTGRLIQSERDLSKYIKKSTIWNEYSNGNSGTRWLLGNGKKKHQKNYYNR